MATASCVRFAREIIDLSRSEIAEVAAKDGIIAGAVDDAAEGCWS